jgi:hypothetical protein
MKVDLSMIREDALRERLQVRDDVRGAVEDHVRERQGVSNLSVGVAPLHALEDSVEEDVQ